MSATDTVRAYYDALRFGEPLSPFFAERDGVVKVGITERLVGYDAVATGLREQTATTTDWTVDSHDLRVGERDGTAWFDDAVALAWTADGERRTYDSRWSGTMVQSGADDDWRFTAMHVSAPH